MLGQRLKQARLEAGLSQRQLCGDTITRNMLSQIENGAAKPSMDTLRYLAARLDKPVSYFLDEETPSPNQALMARARQAYEEKDYGAVLELLKAYRPDGILDAEASLLESLARLAQAEKAIREGKLPYAAALLNGAGEGLYWKDALERSRLLLLSQAEPQKTAELAQRLPADDRELLLRAKAAQQQGDWLRSAHILDAAEDQTAADWCLLRGESCFALGQYAQAAAYFQNAEERALSRLESCYEQLGDYKMAYYYAKRQR